MTGERTMTPTPDLPLAAQQALERGQMIEAIKLTREATGLGLKASKAAVDAWALAHPPTAQPHLGPQQRSRNGWWLAVVIGLGMLLWWRL